MFPLLGCAAAAGAEATAVTGTVQSPDVAVARPVLRKTTLGGCHLTTLGLIRQTAAIATISVQPLAVSDVSD